MVIVQRCPRCNSDKVRFEKFIGIKCLVCSNCGYDERKELSTASGDRSRQKGKSSFTPYRAGGGKRTRKNEARQTIKKRG